MDDEELIRAARNNEAFAGPFLVSLYGPKLAGYCRSIASDLSDTDREHAIANGIERAVRRIETYDPDRGSLLAWLRPFVFHATQDWRRTNARLSMYELTDVPGEAPPDDQPEAASPAADAVRDAFPRLSTADQIVIVLREYERRSVGDTAAILRISPAACRQRHHRALARLGAFLTTDPRIQNLTGETQ